MPAAPRPVPSRPAEPGALSKGGGGEVARRGGSLEMNLEQLIASLRSKGTDREWAVDSSVYVEQHQQQRARHSHRESTKTLKELEEQRSSKRLRNAAHRYKSLHTLSSKGSAKPVALQGFWLRSQASSAMGRLRFELRTNRLKAECSTAELATPGRSQTDARKGVSWCVKRRYHPGWGGHNALSGIVVIPW